MRFAGIYCVYNVHFNIEIVLKIIIRWGVVMLLCDACNYYCETQGGKVRCALTKHVFMVDIEDMSVYPCTNVELVNREPKLIDIEDRKRLKVS